MIYFHIALWTGSILSVHKLWVIIINNIKNLFQHDKYLKPEACGVVLQQN